MPTPPSSRPQSALAARAFELAHPRTLGASSTYEEVQAAVDALADQEFPVETTMIVGTDLRLIERVTGRQTWGRVVGGGIASGISMGLFIGLLFLLFSPEPLSSVLTSILLGIVFFTLWAVVGHALSGGRRDFTSMTATVPMRYELLIEHTHAERARQLLREAGVALPEPPAAAASRSTAHEAGQPSYGQPSVGQPAAEPGEPKHATGTSNGEGEHHSGEQATPGQRPRPIYGRPAQDHSPAQDHGPAQDRSPAQDR